VLVWSRSPGRAEELTASVRERFAIEARATTSVNEVLEAADVVVTATDAPAALFDSSLLRSGQHLSCVGVKTEIAAEVVAASRVVPDSRSDALHEGCFSVALAEGLVEEHDLGPELGEVLSGAAVGRGASEQVTLFDSSGLAVQDVICAREVLEYADGEDLGLLVDFGPEERVGIGGATGGGWR
jgi:alanine dehydrogenase